MFANDIKLTKYRIYIKIYGYGQCLINCNGENLKNICEEYIKKYAKYTDEVTIDVCNTYTGEVRRVWTNKKATLFSNSQRG